MAMTALALKNELVTLAFYDNEPDAIDAWKLALVEFFKLVQANALIALPAGVVAASATMTAAMSGLSVTGAAAIQAGFVAWWAQAAVTPAALWPGAIVVAPPAGLAGLAAALTPVFAANTAGGLSKDASMVAIANAIYPLLAGGQMTMPGPINFPIT